MLGSLAPRIILIVTLPLLPSCGLVRAPFKVAGAVVEGTAKVGKKAYDKSANAFKKSDEEKPEEAKEEAEKEAKEKAGQTKARSKILPQDPAQQPVPEPAPEPLPSDDYLPPLPGTDQPLPDDAPVPYQGQ
ncbi:hypothetical protein OJ996_13440 [Luteolibacter sp. GHJ8]|uniref:Uncharacterized protein n=1 Tax=Luteolibacter rhizosphaerae TaxID=2989719 RepID=A0ABT3G413_9BACT|nr:hypothetical protein [Luteolibacter rhizosphaerae]MCW1914586.1 hypothetical protein [Luteolibacter rhizosphaerae]